MKIAIAPPYNSTIIGTLFNYYLTTELHSNCSYNEYEEKAKKFIQSGNHDPNSLKELKTFFEDKVFIIPENCPEEEKYQFILGFENFCKTVHYVSIGYKPEFMDMKGLQRAPLPDLRAFKYVGVSELNISREPSNYALLFR